MLHHLCTTQAFLRLPAALSRASRTIRSSPPATSFCRSGTDVLVAQGTEAGGHTGTMGLLPFLAGIVRRYPDVPVLAAGGIADGRTLAAVLTAGADGAWLGTAFLATPEAVEVHDVHKRLIVESDGSDTVWTRTYDIVSGLPWPANIGARVRRNRFTDEWSGREATLRDRKEEFAPAQDINPFEAPPDPDTSQIPYGQSASFVDAVRPAADWSGPSVTRPRQSWPRGLGPCCADRECRAHSRWTVSVPRLGRVLNSHAH
ncbi:NAD(P)H-dependent flavin oxidoreductase [Streptomyces sp. NPDC127092]|uniref:NAD(P)H-dependent flavin oxidoreductase n=1 Tax=Streptomyces sp. NPDC127092 TaxID=3347135 RepID=UPI00365D7C18